MAEHEHGSMDTSVHEKTFAGFMSIVSKTTIGIVIFLIFLALVAG